MRRAARLRSAVTARALVAASLAAAPLAVPPAGAGEGEAPHARTRDEIYGRKYGLALTMDVFRPAAGPKGVGIVLVVSGGWSSSPEFINESLIAPLTARGYTVFAVVHGSQPRFTIPEILEDLQRAVRYIRHHAERFEIDPDRIGILGGSSGGHLALMQATAGAEGDEQSDDPVERESGRVQAVACLYPPTDFLNYGEPGAIALGRGPLAHYQAPFAFQEHDAVRNRFVAIEEEARVLEIGRAISPVWRVSPDDPPALLVHGDADALVPLQQSERFVEALEGVGVPASLVVIEGAGHGWPRMHETIGMMADWFEAHLARPARDDRAEDPDGGGSPR